MWCNEVKHGRSPVLHDVGVSASMKVTARTTLLMKVGNLSDDSHYEVFEGDLSRPRSLRCVRQEW